MNPLPAQEPPNGDFVAYLDRLQAESAARTAAASASPALRSAAASIPAVSQHRPLKPAQAEAVPEALLQSAGKRPPSTPAAPLNAEQARELLNRIGSGEVSIAQLVPGAAIALGIVLIVANAIMGSGPIGFFIGVGLVIWGSKRLEAIKKQQRNRS